jgi:hypothetical protein
MITLSLNTAKRAYHACQQNFRIEFVFKRHCCHLMAPGARIANSIKGSSMQKLWVALQAALLVCALMTAAIVLALLAGEARDLPAWVQAVGSIAALFTAIFIMARQNRSAARLMARQNRNAAKLVADADRLATIRRALSVQAVVRRTSVQLFQLEREMATPRKPNETDDELMSRFRVGSSVLSRVRSTMDAIPAFDLGSYNMADGILGLADGLQIYEALLQILLHEPNEAGSPTMTMTLDEHRPTMQRSIQKFEQGLAELQGQ